MELIIALFALMLVILYLILLEIRKVAIFVRKNIDMIFSLYNSYKREQNQKDL